MGGDRRLAASEVVLELWGEKDSSAVVEGPKNAGCVLEYLF